MFFLALKFEDPPGVATSTFFWCCCEIPLRLDPRGCCAPGIRQPLFVGAATCTLTMTPTVTTPFTGCRTVLHLARGTCSETRGSPDDPAHLGQTASSSASANTTVEGETVRVVRVHDFVTLRDGSSCCACAIKASWWGAVTRGVGGAVHACASSQHPKRESCH